MLSTVIKPAKENIKLTDPDVVSSHPSVLIRLLNTDVFKKLDEDTAAYPSNLIQEHRILWNFHFQSGKILLLLSYLLAFKIIYQGKEKSYKAMLLCTIFDNPMQKPGMQKRITILRTI